MSVITGGDQEFYGGRMPFMPARLPQAWDTGPNPYGITDSDLKQAPIPQPILFALHGLRLSQRGMFQPSKAMLPQVYQWGYADNTLYGKTDTDMKGSGIPQPLLLLLNGLSALGRGLFHPAKAILTEGGVFIGGRTDANICQSSIPKPILFTMGLGKKQVFRPLPVSPEAPGPFLTIQGIAKDEARAPMAGVTVYLFNVTSGIPVLVKTATSDGSGLYSFTVEQEQVYWVVDYLTGTPDKTGATLNTLTGGNLADIFAYDPLNPSMGGIMINPGLDGGING